MKKNEPHEEKKEKKKRKPLLVFFLSPTESNAYLWVD